MGRRIKTCVHHLPHVFLLLSWVFLQMLSLTSCASYDDARTGGGCKEIERQALLDFKQGLTDPSARLSSWHGEDCCKWIGVSCDNKTGNVIKIDLNRSCNRTADIYSLAYSNSCLGGEISPSMLNLKHLHYLDLSENNFKGINIPDFFGSLKPLNYLNLSGACFAGMIPSHLGNLSTLHYLNLQSSCSPYLATNLAANSLQWLTGLHSLRYLNMKGVDLSRVAIDWLEHVNMLPTLLELHLDRCRLPNLPSTFPFALNLTSLKILQLSSNGFGTSLPQWLVNLTSLETLDFSGNALQGPLPSALGNMTSLQYLKLRNNHIKGEIPRSFGNLCTLKDLVLVVNNISGEVTYFLNALSGCPNKNLETLELAYNKLIGSLPDSIGSFKKLKSLDLSGNRMSGTIPESIGKLSQISVLDLSENFFEGVLSESHFANLSKLETMYISFMPKNSLVLNISSNWTPPFNGLQEVDLTDTQLGPLFPSWLQFQKNISLLSLENTGISDTLPDWFWNFSCLYLLDLSYNQIRGRIPSEFRLESSSSNSSLASSTSATLLPQFSQMIHLLLRNNSFSGFIPSNIGKAMPSLKYLDLSMNLMNGTIPSSICERTELVGLSLSNNEFTGELPQLCWKKFRLLWYVSLANNKLSGKIPSSLIFLDSLGHLKLNNNKFYGELPASFEKQSGLTSMDVGDNLLFGKIPAWIGKGFPRLRVLGLRSNRFTGEIPSQLCLLSSLQVLDLGGNELSNGIPPCFVNFTVMASVGSKADDIGIPRVLGHSKFSLYVEMTIFKGRELTYTRNLRFLKIIDLSNNNLSGNIPQELTQLVGLNILNLSMNDFRGAIPQNIGQLKHLESLDLSQNQLTGPIPPGISSLSFLSHLNLSHNNLRGRIPTGNQLQTLNDSSVYEGNPELCGPPLTNKCKTVEDPAPSTGSGVEEDGMQSFLASMAVGFVVGICGVLGILVSKNSWRRSYFKLIDGVVDRIYDFTRIEKAADT